MGIGRRLVAEKASRLEHAEDGSLIEPSMSNPEKPKYGNASDKYMA